MVVLVWIKEVQNVIARKMEGYITLCNHISEENRTKCNFVYCKVKKMVFRRIKMEADKEIKILSESPNKIFRYLKMIKRDRKNRKAVESF